LILEPGSTIVGGDARTVGGVTVAVIVHVVLEGVTPEQYDAVRTECGWLSEVPVGGVAHLSWWDGNDNHNVDAWESEEAFGAFGQERLGPAMAKVGVSVEPKVRFFAAHEVFLPSATTITAS
jgi:hypothetical protein